MAIRYEIWVNRMSWPIPITKTIHLNHCGVGFLPNKIYRPSDLMLPTANGVKLKRAKIKLMTTPVRKAEVTIAGALKRAERPVKIPDQIKSFKLYNGPPKAAIRH